ncbi:MAG: transporter substrate-binding domain-containing protein, partial [Acidobacteriota bacterium]
MRRPRSWILGSFALAVVALFTGACDRQSASPSDHDPPPIVFGVDRDLPPYSFVDESGAVRGLSVDLLRSIFDKLGSPLEIQAVASEDLHDRLESGAVDALAHVPYTDHLAERFLLSLPHTDVSDAFFVRVDTEPGEGESGDVESAWLQERTVVVLRDDPSYDFAARWAAEEDLRAEPSVARALRVLASGEADLALLPMEPALLLAKRLRLSQVRVLPNAPVDYTRGLSFAVRPDHGALLEDLERGLMIVTREGAYLEIYNRWQTDPGDSSRLLNLLTWTLLPTAALMLLFGGWSFALRRTVAARTRELERAAADRRALERRIQRAGKLQSLGAL